MGDMNETGSTPFYDSEGRISDPGNAYDVAYAQDRAGGNTLEGQEGAAQTEAILEQRKYNVDVVNLLQENFPDVFLPDSNYQNGIKVQGVIYDPAKLSKASPTKVENVQRNLNDAVKSLAKDSISEEHKVFFKSLLEGEVSFNETGIVSTPSLAFERMTKTIKDSLRGFSKEEMTAMKMIFGNIKEYKTILKEVNEERERKANEMKGATGTSLDDIKSILRP